MSLTNIMVLCLAGFCSGVIKTGVGVGSGIFLLPTLALGFSAKTALAIAAPMMLVSDILGLRYYWRQWLSRSELTRLLAAIIPGLLLGIYLLPMIPGDIFRVCVGIFGITYTLDKLWADFPATKLLKKACNFLTHHDAQAQRHSGAYFYGFLGGLATVLAHAGGVVWSLYLVTAARDRRVFVGTTIFLFFLTNIYKTVSYMYIDLLTADIILQILPAIPMILLGAWVGNYVNRKCNQELFRKIILYFILVTCITLCF